MQAPDGYTLKKALSTMAAADVYLASRETDGLEVVLKSYRGDTRDGRAAQEQQMLQALAGAGVPRVLELVSGSGPPTLVLERVAGLTLSAWIKLALPPLHAFLKVAMQLADVLARVHSARLVHSYLVPDNVSVDPTSLRTHLLDFSRAQAFGAQARRFDMRSDSDDFTELLRYTAPEQAGRMNRGIDMRSDLYSLGALLYFGATRRPPFESRDPLALIHAHMARRPQPPHELRPDLPSVVSRMILKLLEKEPEERYQSAGALLADLQMFRDQLERGGEVDDGLVLGSAEAPERPRFPRKLYGREAELALQRGLFEKACTGTPQLLMLAGEPGAGKSALVDELRPDLAQTGGYLAVGKFDLSRDRPYSAWTAALAAFVQQRLVDSDERLQSWRARLSTNLGSIAQAVVDLVPDLRFVLGDVPPIPALGPRETQARLGLALQRFVTACATAEHPLVLFLDDLQWSDAASRELLEDLLGSNSGAALLIVGAYRANEVHADHPLTHFFGRLTQRGIAVQHLTFRPLSLEATAAMLGEALERTVEDVRDLAQLVARKTGTAPLFIRQFVDHLHGKGFLRYRRGSGWCWDADQVAAAEIPEGAVAIMMARLNLLHSGPRQVIELASCVGDEFDTDLLCQLSSQDRAAIEQGLYALADAGLVAPSAKGFRFAHDRIREAASALLPESARTRLHYDIAQFLLARVPEAEQGARILEIAEHWDYGLAHAPESERMRGMRINLAAGARALVAGAASTSEAFLSVGRTLHRPQDWHDEPKLSFDLFLQSSESAFLRRRYEQALELCDVLDQQRLELVQRAQVAAKRIQVLALLLSPEECSRHTLAALRRCGVRWALRPLRARVVWTMRFLQWQLRLRGTDAALRPALAAPAPARMATLTVLGTGGPTLARTSGPLGALMSCWAVSGNLRHGAIGRPSYSLVSLAAYFQLILEDPVEAEHLESAALEGLTRSPEPLYGPRSELLAHGLLRPFRMRRRTALAPLEAVAEKLHELGDLEFHCYARFLKAAFSALAGDPVRAALLGLQEQADSIRRAGHRYPGPALFLRPYRLLGHDDPQPPSFEAEIAASEAEIRAESGGIVEPYVRTVWLLVLCVYGRWDLAFAQSEVYMDRVFQVIPYVHVVDYMFYRGLAASALASSQRGQARRRYARALRESERRLRTWAKTGPDFGHMATLLGAELARLAGDERRALRLYGDAARRAQVHEFPNHVAIAHERKARLLLHARRRTEASGALVQAVQAYRAWGCESRAAELSREVRELRTDHSPGPLRERR